MSPPATVRAFIAGSSGSGKSTAAWRFYLSRFPRRIILDLTGEWKGHADATVYSARELSLALRKLAARGRWTISAGIGIEELPSLVPYLIPLPEVSVSPILLCGGAVLLVDEVDLVAPPRSLSEEVRTLWRRSRHVGLSIIATTQRPEAVSREVSAQSHQVLCLQLVEPSGLDYMADLMRTDLSTLPAWWQRHPHGGLWRELLSGRMLFLTEQGNFEAPPPPLRAPALPRVSVADGASAGAAPEPSAAPKRQTEGIVSTLRRRARQQ